MGWASSIVVRALAYCAGQSRFGTHFELRVGHSLTVHPAANGGPVGNTGEVKAARKGTGHPTSPS